MIRFLFRALGFLLLATAFAALVVDGTRSIAGGQALFYPLGDTAAWLAGARFKAVTSLLSDAPPSARSFAVALLAAPAWVFTGLLGLLFLVLGRRSDQTAGLPLRRS
ncbi:MAG: hypothetical protein ACRYGP_33465 [Janthinobacterium lividum]